MDRKTKMRLMSFLLCFVMLFGFMPKPAFAAVTIRDITINGIHAPAAGEKAAEMSTYNAVSVPSGVPYELRLQSFSWKDEKGTVIDDINYEFESGRTYSVDFNVYAKVGCVFDDPKNIKLTLGGISSDKYSSEVTYIHGDRSIITVKFTFTVSGTRTYPDINKVEFRDIRNPRDGETPSVSFVHLYDNSEVVSSYWSYGSKVMGKSDRFSAGEKYYFNVVLKANSGYKFSNDVDVWQNNGPVKCEKQFSSDKKELTVKIPYYITELYEIAAIEIGGLELPKHGSFAYPVRENFMCVPSNSDYTIVHASYSWKNSSGKILNGSNAFWAGEKYTLQVIFDANDGYKFADPKNISATFTGLDFSKYSVSDIKYAGGTDYLEVSYTFTAEHNPPETRITEVEINGVVPPKSGSPVSTSAYVPDNCGYKIIIENGAPLVTWWNDSSQITKNYETDTAYEVRIHLIGDGTLFKEDGVFATVNGKKATVDFKNHNKIVVKYTFPETSVGVLSSIKVNVPFPVHGGDFPVPSLSDDYSRIYAYEWYDGDFRVGSWDTVQEGKTYRLKVRLTTTYEYDTNTVVTVNGDYATIQSLEYNSILFYYDFIVPISGPSGVLLGDCNCDGFVNARDSQRLYEHIVGKEPLENGSYGYKAADVNEDGIINARDSQRLYEHIVGKDPLH